MPFGGKKVNSLYCAMHKEIRYRVFYYFDFMFEAQMRKKSTGFMNQLHVMSKKQMRMIISISYFLRSTHKGVISWHSPRANQDHIEWTSWLCRPVRYYWCQQAVLRNHPKIPCSHVFLIVILTCVI